MFYKLIKTNRFMPRWAAGVAVAPFILVRPEKAKCRYLIEHEKIHIKQQYRLLWVGFAVLYYGSKKWRLKFELEAYRKSVSCGQPLDGAAVYLSSNYGLNLTHSEARRLLAGEEPGNQ